MRNIELLSPCGDFERLKLALKFGADAVYLAGEMFGMRTNPSNFNNACTFAWQKSVSYLQYFTAQ